MKGIVAFFGLAGALLVAAVVAPKNPEKTPRLRIRPGIGDNAPEERLPEIRPEPPHSPPGSVLDRVDALFTAARSPDPEVAYSALDELGERAKLHPGDAARITGFLARFARTSADSELRSSAVAYIEFDALEEVEARDFLTLLGDPDEDVRLAVIEVLGSARSRRESALAALNATMRSESSDSIRERILDARDRLNGSSSTESRGRGPSRKL